MLGVRRLASSGSRAQPVQPGIKALRLGYLARYHNSRSIATALTPSSPPSRPLRVSFVTDIEGDVDFFFRYVSISTVITTCKEQFTRSARSHETLTSDDVASFQLDFLPQEDGKEPHFVFGGDLFDHGPGDLRLAEALVKFKCRYPDRVHLIAGNRDLNKLRLLSELDSNVLELPATHPGIFYPYWQQAKYTTTLSQFLDQHGKSQGNASGNASKYGPLDFVPKSWRNGPGMQPNSDEANPSFVDRLRWILRHTMGAANAFENRRHELEIIQGGHISDADVFKSFRDSVAQGGVVRDYLEQTQLMLILGDTMFLHGALRDENLGRVPSSQTAHTNAHQWCQALNQWHSEELRSWSSSKSDITMEPFFRKWETLNNTSSKSAGMLSKRLPKDHPMRLRSGGSLMDYGVPGGAEGRSVVYSSWLDFQHYPDPCAAGSTHVGSMLANAGIVRVITGHVPHGDCPTVLHCGDGDCIKVSDENDIHEGEGKVTGKENDSSFTVIMCDTTYCAGSPGDWHSRGKSVVEVLVDTSECTSRHSLSANDMTDGCRSTVRMHGQLVDGSWYDLVVEDWVDVLGRKLPDGRYVGYPMPGNDMLTLWLPGQPFPSNIQRSSIAVSEVFCRLNLK